MEISHTRNDNRERTKLTVLMVCRRHMAKTGPSDDSSETLQYTVAQKTRSCAVRVAKTKLVWMKNKSDRLKQKPLVDREGLHFCDMLRTWNGHTHH